MMRRSLLILSLSTLALAAEKKPNIPLLYADDLGFSLPDAAAEDSHSLLPLLNGQQEVIRQSHVHNTYPGKYAIRLGDWFYIDRPTGYSNPKGASQWEKANDYTADDLKVELFNRKSDPSQRVNLAGKEPERVAAMKAQLQKIREQGYSAPRL